MTFKMNSIYLQKLEYETRSHNYINITAIETEPWTKETYSL